MAVDDVDGSLREPAAALPAQAWDAAFGPEVCETAPSLKRHWLAKTIDLPDGRSVTVGRDAAGNSRGAWAFKFTNRHWVTQFCLSDDACEAMLTLVLDCTEPVGWQHVERIVYDMASQPAGGSSEPTASVNP